MQAINKYGLSAQTDMAIEEMSELIKALLKSRRIESHNDRYCGNIEDVYKNIQEEIVDVEIMLDQLKIMYGYDESIRAYKINRLVERMKG